MGSFSLEDGDQKTSDPLSAGTYSVSESVSSNWIQTSATCSDGSSPSSISLAADETVTCTFTNAKKSTIIVKKETVPDNHPEEFDFKGAIVDTLGDGDSESKSVAPGTYTVTADLANSAPAYWKLTDIDCDDSNSSGNLGTLTATYNVSPGETVKCTFTNEKRGLITVVKQTTPDGATQSFSFNANYNADGSRSRTAKATRRPSSCRAPTRCRRTSRAAGRSRARPAATVVRSTPSS